VLLVLLFLYYILKTASQTIMTSSGEGLTSQKRKKRDSSSASSSNVEEVAAVPVLEDPQKLREEVEMERKENAELKKKLAESEKKNEESEKENAELKKKLAESEKKNEELDKHNSVDELFAIGIPVMAVNPACKPSITDNVNARKIVSDYRSEMLVWDKLSKGEQEKVKESKPKRFDIHEPAKISVHPLLKKSLEFAVNSKDGQGRRLKSVLMMEKERTEGGTLKHHNETSPQDYLAMAIKDVIWCSGFPATVVKEATLFALRPDLIVVFHEGRVLFVVEVKNPPTVKHPEHRDSIFTAETAAGQTLAYLKGLKQNGIDQPFALLSTYNESVIVRLDADDEAYAKHLMQGALNAGVKPEERHKQKVQKGDGTEPKKPPVSPKKGSHLNLKLPSLPEKKKEETSSDEEGEDMTVSSDDYAKQSAEYDYKGRKVVYSQVFRVTELYKILSLLFESSLVSAKDSKESVKALVPKHDSKLTAELCTLYAESYSWERVNISHVSYNDPPLFCPGQKFHVLCVLGQGGTGRSLLCCTSTGRMFAAKLFLVNTSAQYLEQDRMNDHEEEIGVKMALAETERSRWVTFAPKCAKYCKVKCMNGMPALTMPFFPPIPFEKREQALPLIEARLTEIAQQGYVYDRSDLRWRHFGCRWSNGDKMEITLLDLGSLVKRTSDTATIASQMVDLRKRMGSEPVKIPGPVFT
jgi:predicted metal-binding protein